MSLAFVKEVASVAATNSTNPQVLTVPAAGVAAGNILVLTGGLAGGSTITAVTDTGGNTWTLNTVAQNDRNSTNRGLLAYAVCATGLVSGDHINVTSSNAGFANRIYLVSEHSGNVSSSPLDKTTSVPDSFPTANLMDSGSTATTTQADELLVGVFAYNSTSNTITSYGSGYTGMTTLSAGFRVASGWRIVSATGAYNAQATQSGTAVVWGAGIATFKAATSGNKAIVPATINATSAMSGAVQRLRPIPGGAINATSNVTGNIVRLRPLSGTVSATSNVSGAVARLRPIVTATINATSAVAGTVTRTGGGQIVPAAINASSNVSGSIIRLRVISGGSISATSTVVATVQAIHVLSGATITATSTITATVTISGGAPAIGNYRPIHRRRVLL